jgi:hypothetical protein
MNPKIIGALVGIVVLVVLLLNHRKKKAKVSLVKVNPCDICRKNCDSWDSGCYDNCNTMCNPDESPSWHRDHPSGSSVSPCLSCLDNCNNKCNPPGCSGCGYECGYLCGSQNR